MELGRTTINLSDTVYDQTRPRPTEQALAFYRQAAERACGPLLEPMCGSGRYLLPLAQEGFGIWGFDSSESMLLRLKAKVSNQNLPITTWQSLVQDFECSERFGLIFIPSGSFGLVTQPEQVQMCLEKFYEHLQLDGVLLLEMDTPAGLPALDIWRSSTICPTAGPEIGVQRLLTRDETDSAIYHSTTIYSCGARTEQESFSLRIYQPENFIELLREAGFREIAVYAAFDKEQRPNHTTASIVYECKK